MKCQPCSIKQIEYYFPPQGLRESSCSTSRQEGFGNNRREQNLSFEISKHLNQPQQLYYNVIIIKRLNCLVGTSPMIMACKSEPEREGHQTRIVLPFSYTHLVSYSLLSTVFIESCIASLNNHSELNDIIARS